MFWRRRDDKIVSLLLDGWFRESSPLSKKKSIMVGSPGIGKSTLLCYQDIPAGVQTDKMLAPSQQVDLNSGERTDAYCCLFPCWSRTDLFSVGKLFYKFHRKDMIERFYYSGGSVCEFTLSTCTDIIEAIDNAISSVNYVSNLLNNKSSISTGGSQVDRLRHTFVKNRRGISPLYSKEW
ncbi:unnamed protein product [Peronospora farinosa]|uniref:Uncharacterized protein n=1 Tax=Peronospora farinosa TaxID=134698 RepID=A0AAV0UBB6_9STRA|nr:unnamed protein product [Peronospora farinosa]